MKVGSRHLLRKDVAIGGVDRLGLPLGATRKVGKG
jgi:hypothetical protein